MSTDVEEVGFSYLKTLPGILKVAQEVINFLGMICAAAGGLSASADAFLTCSVIGIIVTGALLICYISSIVIKIKIAWTRFEFFFSVIWTIFYLVVSSILVSNTGVAAYVAGGIFGFIAMLLYAADAYHSFRIAAMTTS